MKFSFVFNGDAQLLLIPEHDDDYKALDLLLNGKRLKDVKKPVKDSEQQEAAVFTFTREKDPT